MLKEHQTASKSIDTKRTIYLTIVRAYLAYSSPVWPPPTVDNIKNIERIQRRATKYILAKVGHLQLALVVGSKTKSTDVFNVLLGQI